MDHYPQRIVCLTEETTETLYLLGEEDRIVGISGFTMRPPQARKEKPKVSTFLDAKIEEITDLQPDLVIGFSDIQSNIAKQLIDRGVTVWINNHRSVQGILDMMVQLGALVGKSEEARELVDRFEALKKEISREVETWEYRPSVYFEEWYDPLISGIQWVSEIIELAGGHDIYPERAKESLAKHRIIENPDDVVEMDPEIILVSWCGKMFKKDRMTGRAGWSTIRAIEREKVFEIPSEIILQPGPAALFDGLPMLHQIIKEARNG